MDVVQNSQKYRVGFTCGTRTRTRTGVFLRGYTRTPGISPWVNKAHSSSGYGCGSRTKRTQVCITRYSYTTRLKGAQKKKNFNQCPDVLVMRVDVAAVAAFVCTERPPCFCGSSRWLSTSTGVARRSCLSGRCRLLTST